MPRRFMFQAIFSALMLLVGGQDPPKACECSEGYVVCESKGRIYSGQCEGDNREGYGIHQLSDGGRYEGQFTAGHVHGYGHNTLKDGALLRGTFVEEKFDGFGVYRWPNGQVTGRFCPKLYSCLVPATDRRP